MPRSRQVPHRAAPRTTADSYRSLHRPINLNTHRSEVEHRHYINGPSQLWLGLENLPLDHAAKFDGKTGPVLHESDPPYRGIQVPLRFWKVAAFIQDGSLASTAYILDLGPLPAVDLMPPSATQKTSRIVWKATTTS
ncbi:DNA/RNA non-specific endonuclease [Streptomyces sp. NPDC090077]|uniref:DNA/RNA non-specific endonuclease n=1 Tax=Streptomyces sp. NPDC090077 TaxID=3365938 RepID=UPI0037F783EF